MILEVMIKVTNLDFHFGVADKEICLKYQSCLRKTQMLKQIKLLGPGNVREEHVTHGKAIECNMQEKNGN